ncbi:MAG: AAA family ATPase [Clostridiales bacterium]|nr:AAA family ATPase [Clostridiales bacterium]
MKKNVIFIGGVHGVGKTTTCNRIVSNINIKHYSSSKLISKLRNDVVNVNKKVIDINNNQNILLQALDIYTDRDTLLLLDGHFCLINRDGAIEKIPIQTFESLGIVHIILLVDNPYKISQRLKDRDYEIYTTEFIDNFQKYEIEYAKIVAKEIGIKLDIVDKNSHKNVLQEFKLIISNLKNRDTK